MELVTKHHICKFSTWITVQPNHTLNVALHSNKHNLRFHFFSFIQFAFFVSFAFHKVSNSFHFVQFEMSFQFWMSSVLWVFPFVQKFNLKFFCWSFCTVECSTVFNTNSNIHLVDENERGLLWNTWIFFPFLLRYAATRSHSFFLLKCYHFRFNFSFFLSFHPIQRQPFCVHFNLVLLSVVERFCFNVRFCVCGEVGVGTRFLIQICAEQINKVNCNDDDEQTIFKKNFSYGARYSVLSAQLSSSAICINAFQLNCSS